MPHAVVYIVDNPTRIHTGKRIRTRRGVVWIAWTPTVEDARAVAGINDGRWSGSMLALSEPLRTVKHLAGHSMTLPPLNTPVPSLGREQAS